MRMSIVLTVLIILAGGCSKKIEKKRKLGASEKCDIVLKSVEGTKKALKLDINRDREDQRKQLDDCLSNADAAYDCVLKKKKMEQLFCVVEAFAGKDDSTSRPEIQGNLMKMYLGASVYFKNPQNHMDPKTREPGEPTFPPNSLLTPLRSCCDGKTPVLCDPSGKGPVGYNGAKEWGDSTWKALGFRITKPHRFQYQYLRVSPTEFHVIAWGDRNCDGKKSKYFIVSRSNDNVVARTDVLVENQSE